MHTSSTLLAVTVQCSSFPAEMEQMHGPDWLIQFLITAAGSQ